MARWRRAIELGMSAEEIESLTTLSRSRSEPARRVQRARMLLAYREMLSFYEVGRSLGVHHQTVERCIERALASGPLAALDDRPRIIKGLGPPRLRPSQAHARSPAMSARRPAPAAVLSTLSRSSDWASAR